MGFFKPGTDEKAPKIDLRVWDHRYFKLLTRFAFRPQGWSKEDEIVVPAHSPNGDRDKTDLASVPAFLWGLLPSYGRQLRAALMHDHLCDEVNENLRAGRGAGAYAARRRADQLFWLAMRDPGNGQPEDLQRMVPWFRGRIFWAGVGIGRYWKLRRLRALLMSLQIAIGLVALYLAVGRSLFDWNGNTVMYLLTYVAALLLCVLWWKDAGIPLIGLLIAPIVAPVVAITLLAQLLLALPDFVIKLASRQQPKPIVGPTFRLPHLDNPPPEPPGGASPAPGPAT